MNIVLCEYVNKNKYNAGNKARNDVLLITKKLGYKHIALYRSGASKILVMIHLIRGSIDAVLCAGKNEKILIQYPYYPSAVNKLLFAVLNFGKKIKKYKLELVVHDVIGLRNGKLDTGEGQAVLASEIGKMSIFDKVICHNEAMKKVFNTFSPETNCKVLGPFDYLYNGKSIVAEPELPWKIVIAGNLKQEKCGYLYKLPNLSNIKFELYGPDYSGSPGENISYHGSFSPDELISHINGHFGLVWDGESCELCSGAYGQYLKYNNPHKFSLYLASGIPVIVWTESALARYVEEKGIGLCVSSLEEMDIVLNGLEREKYYSIKDNVLKIRKDIISGKHLMAALAD